MAIIYLALGSNVGDSKDHIEQAINLLAKEITGIVQAPFYQSRAVGYTKQPNFINTAIKGSTELLPQTLLKYIKDIEQEIGRIKRFRWGPREVDIDVIFYDDAVIDEPNLRIPHVSFSERDFVLKPLCDLDPNFVDPITKLTVGELMNKLPESALSIVKQD